jgi:hypothetical protein
MASMCEWRAIEGFPGYFVSDLGEVESRGFYKHNKRLKPLLGNHGYYGVGLSVPGRPARVYLIHRLVAQAFLPNPGGKKQVNHLSGDRSDNRLENLEWVTPQENADHAKSRGFLRVGEAAHGSVLKSWDAWRVPQWVDGGLSDTEIAKILGVRRETIGQVRRGSTWSHITGLAAAR